MLVFLIYLLEKSELHNVHYEQTYRKAALFLTGNWSVRRNLAPSFAHYN